VNGIVIKRAIEKGQTVAASLQSPELFVIAQNLQDMQVEASIDESDVGRIRTGQKATFTVDAFPGQTFEGQVSQVRKAAQNVANVVTYVAVVAFSNAGGRLLPGMTANVRVVVESRESVLKAPNAALRVRIAGVEPAGAASAPASRASGSASGQAGGWSWISQALAQPAAGGGLAALRERLISELKLSTEQQVQFDAISAELRPKYAALRDLPEDARAGARDKVSAEMRERIGRILTPEQLRKYQQMQTTGAPATAPQAAASTAPVSASKSKPLAAPAPAAQPAKAPESAAAAAPSGGGNPATEFRNRVVSELALSPSQIEKVDAIYADARSRFMALRELSPEERGKARERVTADIRARIGDLLTAEQKPKYAALVAQAAGRQNTRGRIYLVGEDSQPRAYNVRLGITDGTSTELLVEPNSPDANVLKEGALVIVGTVTPGSAQAQSRPSGSGPRMPF
jgi:Spy/CpxP family protein refolding chaperone